MRDLLYTDASYLNRSQAQLVCIARALALRPGLLLMDEPTRLLDSMGRDRGRSDLRPSERKGLTVTVAVHCAQMAGRIAEETAMMEDGTVLEWGRAGDLFYASAAPAHQASSAQIA